MEGKTALIAGATGLIGKELLHFLVNANEYNKVIALVRRSIGIEHPKLEERIVDFDHLDQYQEIFAVDDVFCALGTTIKKAKTKEAMWKIDVDYPVAIARLASSKRAKKFLLVSSMNANPESPIFYSKMKGKLEEEIKQIPFETTAIFRPSLLLGSGMNSGLVRVRQLLFSPKRLFSLMGHSRNIKRLKAGQLRRPCIVQPRRMLRA